MEVPRLTALGTLVMLWSCAPQRPELTAACPHPYVNCCHRMPHGCYLPATLGRDAEDSAVLRDAWSSYLADHGEANLWRTAGGAANTVRCSSTNFYALEAAIVTLVEQPDGSSAGVLKPLDPAADRRWKHVRVEADAWQALLRDAWDQANRWDRSPRAGYFTVHSAERSHLLEVIVSRSYAAREVTLPYDQESGAELAAFCASLRGLAGATTAPGRVE